MITVDDMLVDALPTEMLKDFVNAVNAIQNGLEEKKAKKESHLKQNRRIKMYGSLKSIIFNFTINPVHAPYMQSIT